MPEAYDILANYSEEIPSAAGYYVYRLWAGDGTCLYVGRVGDNGPRSPRARLSNHRRTKTWWPDVARIEVAELPDHPAIVAEEAEQIRVLQPLHNTQRRNCGHDLSLPGAVKPSSGQCSTCAREYSKEYGKKYNSSAARAAYEASPARKAKKRERDRKRPSDGARAAMAKRRASVGQASLWD